MLIALGVLVVAALVWLLRGKVGSDGPSPIDRVPLGPPYRPSGGRPIPEAELPWGRIAVSGLAKQYKDVKAVDDLSFVVEPGRVTGFLGPNGAGKTTTLRMILGLVVPTAGTATIGGVRYAELAQPTRRVGCVLEAGAAHRGRTGRDHLRVICQSAGIPLGRADEVLELAGLTPVGNRKFREYSLGMRQRLGIAAALIGDPQVLILDEPANGLDPEGIRWMRDILKGLAAHGRTILVSSHLLSEMELLADDLIIIVGGQLAAHGAVASVVGSVARGSRTRLRTPDVEGLTAVLGSGATVTPGSAGEVYVSGVDAAAIGDAAQRAGIAVHQLTTEHPDLEDAFLTLTRERRRSGDRARGPS